jgi:hypothetical protein
MHQRIGGTAIAALLGEDSFGRTPLDIYNRIVLGARTPPNRYMARGLALENEVRRRYVSDTGAIIQPHPGVVHWRECFAASVDDLCEREGTAGVVDYKSASAKSRSKWKKGPLASYIWQGRLYMAVFDRPRFDLFVLFGHDRDATKDEPGAFSIGDEQYAVFEPVDTELFTIEREPESEMRLISAGEAFWNTHIVPRSPPASPPVPEPERLENPELTNAEIEALAAFDVCQDTR